MATTSDDSVIKLGQLKTFKKKLTEVKTVSLKFTDDITLEGGASVYKRLYPSPTAILKSPYLWVNVNDANSVLSKFNIQLAVVGSTSVGVYITNKTASSATLKASVCDILCLTISTL